MRRTPTLAILLILSAGAPGLAQIRSDPGTVGGRAVGPSQGGDAGRPSQTSVPAGEARRDNPATVPQAIPADQARATIQDKCGGTVADLGLDDHSTWHAKCQKDGSSQTVTLGPDGNVQMR